MVGGAEEVFQEFSLVFSGSETYVAYAAARLEAGLRCVVHRWDVLLVERV